MKNKVIVTGATGFIGNALLKELSKNNIETIAVVRDEKSKISGIKNLPGVRIVYCPLENIKNLPDIISDRDIYVCIHLAWTGVFDNEKANYNVQLDNVKYALDAVNAIAKLKVKRFVGAGSLAEKDVLAYLPISGSTPNAKSMYGIAKITTHFMTKTECARLGLEHVWCCISNTYGEGNKTENFINMAARKMLKGERAAFTSGEQFYDFVYITDMAKAIFAVMCYGGGGGHIISEVINQES